MSVVQYTQVLSRGCSMNIHKKVVVATVQGKGIPKKSRSYNTFTSSLTLKERYPLTIILVCFVPWNILYVTSINNPNVWYKAFKHIVYRFQYMPVLSMAT